jgi:hypothetical protein
LKWGDINFAQGTINVTRSIVCGVVGPCKTESSQKPVPVHPTVLEALANWRKGSKFTCCDDWVFATRRHPGQEADLGPSNIAQIYSSRRVAGRNSETIRMAYISTHVLHSTAKCRHRVQSDAGVAAAFLVTRSTLDVYTRQSRHQNTLRKQRSLRWSSLLKRTPAQSRKSGQTGESRARENGSN